MKFIGLILMMLSPAVSQPLQLLPENPHYFFYDGKPLVLIGSGEHYGAVLNLDFDYDVYLETMQQDGQNLTRLFTGAYVEKLGAFGIKQNTLAPAENKFQPPWARSTIPGYINGGNKFDLDKWNPDYFVRLADFIHKADERGIFVELVLFSSIYTDENWRYMPFHPENNVNSIKLQNRVKCHTLDNGDIFAYQEKMVRKIVRELNKFDNIYYEIQNEPWADQADSAGVILEHLIDDKLPNKWQNLIELANESSLRWQEKIASIIADEEKMLAKKHLIAQNYCNFIHPLSQVDENISILNFHYALPQCVNVNLGWNRPISFDESGFAGPGPDVYRRQAWRFIMSGGAVYNGLDYSFYPGFENGDGELHGPGGGGKKLRQQLAVLRRFIESFDLAQMQPDQASLMQHPGLFVYLLSTPGEQYAGYIEGRKSNRITLKVPNGSYSAKWIDVKSGLVVSEQTVVTENSLMVISTPMFDGELAFDIRKR
ncbi:hypothetical protein EH223_16865 [candidate division KSB1 bacterium]|nr:hypothetical protein [candidate division KSB1 bacterium]RQW00824.1 MAG: hypothetical protein EH223_16865 [candidate division KSB1 bacterium]